MSDDQPRWLDAGRPLNLIFMHRRRSTQHTGHWSWCMHLISRAWTAVSVRCILLKEGIREPRKKGPSNMWCALRLENLNSTTMLLPTEERTSSSVRPSFKDRLNFRLNIQERLKWPFCRAAAWFSFIFGVFRATKANEILVSTRA